MNTPEFLDSRLMTREEFYNITAQSRLVFYHVYTGQLSDSLEIATGECQPGDQRLRFDIACQSEEVREMLSKADRIECKAYGIPEETGDIPLPYIGAFVPGMTFVGIAWTPVEVERLVLRARKDSVMIGKWRI